MKPFKFTIVDTEELLEEFLEDLEGEMAFDIETTGLYPWDVGSAITSLGFGWSSHQWLIPWEHAESPWTAEDRERIIELIDQRLDEEAITFVGSNLKFDCVWVQVIEGLDWSDHMGFDIMLCHFLLDENDRHGLKHLAMALLGADDWDISVKEKKGNTSYLKLASYHAGDIYWSWKLKRHLARQLKEDWDINRVFHHIMMPIARLFVEVEINGVYIDTSKFDDAEAYLKERIEEASKELANYGDINWGSTQQLAQLLFEDLGLKVIDKTPKGAPSTSESVIKRLDHPVGEALLKFRGARQQLSFFIDGWKPYLHKSRIHPSFKLHGTVTGRLSCEHPNLQQVPRDPRIRNLISAPKGWEFVEMDLSQIELRIAAELAGEQTMLHAFETGQDVHWITLLRELGRGGSRGDLIMATVKKYCDDTGLSYGEAIDKLLEMGPEVAVSIHKEWKELRKKAKAINFGFLYGMWWKKFQAYARDNYGVNVTAKEAQESRKVFFDTYSGLSSWHDRQRRYARRHGYVKSLSGRKRRLPDAMSHRDSPARGNAERQAINSPVQSFANELNLMIMIEARERFRKNVLKMVGAVHDATLMWIRTEAIPEVGPQLLEIATHPKLLDTMDINLRVPLEAEMEIGPWGAGISLNRWLEGERA